MRWCHRYLSLGISWQKIKKKTKTRNVFQSIEAENNENTKKWPLFYVSVQHLQRISKLHIHNKELLNSHQNICATFFWLFIPNLSLCKDAFDAFATFFEIQNCEFVFYFFISLFFLNTLRRCLLKEKFVVLLNWCWSLIGSISAVD